MKEKKTAVITFRTEEWVKDLLEEIATQNKWSIAQTVNELCKNFVTNPQPEKITVKTKELLKSTQELILEGEETGTQITIAINSNEENNEIYKELRFEVLESGGHGCIADFDTIKEMTEEEILDIP